MNRGLSATIIAFVRLYQWTLSPIFGRQCRFRPTCSNYMIEAVEKYGPFRGAVKGNLADCPLQSVLQRRL